MEQPMMNNVSVANNLKQQFTRIMPSMTISDIEQRADDIGLTTQNVAQGLGFFSLALGLTEVVLTRSLAKAAGFSPEHTTLLRIFGFREITSGAGLLAGKNQKAWMWSRVVGDALDVAFMGYAFAQAKTKSERKRLLIAAAVVSPIIIMDVMNSLRETKNIDLRKS